MKSRRDLLTVAVTSVVLFGSVLGFTTPASALTAKSKPARTSLTQVAVVGYSPALAQVKVTFARAKAHSKAPVLSSEVLVGTLKCTVNKSQTSCMVRKVKYGTTVKVRVRSRNRNGWGPWSTVVAFQAVAGAVWPSTTGTTPGTTLPPARTDLTRAKVLGTTTVKLSKVEALRRSGVSSASVRAARAHALAAGDVVFKTSGVVAYAQAPESSRTGSKLLAVSSTGSVSDALESGTAVVKEFFSSPNGKVYVAFESATALVVGGPTCILAEIDATSGVPSCVDSSISSINWGLGYNIGSGNPPVQFDTAGNLYYAGTAGSTGVLRRSANGSTSDLLNDNITLQDFVVLGDGTVIVLGATNSTQAKWARRIAPSGGLKNLATGTAMSMKMFADGNVYMGLWGGDSFGFKRYLAASDALEEKYWISGNTNGVNRDAYFAVGGTSGTPVEGCASALLSVNTTFCGWYGTAASPWFNVSTQKTFAVAGAQGQTGRALWQYFPTVEKANVTAVTSIAVSHQFGASIILAGVNSKSTNVTSVYDTSTSQETVVLDGTNEIEIYSLSYSSTKNAILYSGLRFADNQYVIGEISLG